MIVTFLLFAVVFLLSILLIFVYLYQGNKRKTTIPGLEATHPKFGNLSEIKEAGSLIKFLIKRHAKHGGIFSFYMGENQVVSIASPELFSQHFHVFDRPVQMFELLEPLIGAECIQFANGTDGRSRRHAYDRAFSFDNMQYIYPVFQQLADEQVKQWQNLPEEEHFNLRECMFDITIKSILKASFCKSIDDKLVKRVHTCYEKIWFELEGRLTNGLPEPGSDREKTFNKYRDEFHKAVNEVIQTRRDNPPDHKDELLLIDTILKMQTGRTVLSDSLAYMIGGFHTTASLLIWLFYYLARDPEIQEKLYKEAREVLEEEPVSLRVINDLVYTRQVIDEALRCSQMAPFAARVQDFDSELGGHKIPANTPVIHALGASYTNETIWPDHKKFDPDRFSPENLKKLPAHAFEPFGFAGKRKCPAYRYSYIETTVFITTYVRKFKFFLTSDVSTDVAPRYGLVTCPDEEIWLKIKKR